MWKWRKEDRRAGGTGARLHLRLPPGGVRGGLRLRRGGERPDLGFSFSLFRHCHTVSSVLRPLLRHLRTSEELPSGISDHSRVSGKKDSLFDECPLDILSQKGGGGGRGGREVNTKGRHGTEPVLKPVRRVTRTVGAVTQSRAPVGVVGPAPYELWEWQARRFPGRMSGSEPWCS